MPIRWKKYKEHEQNVRALCVEHKMKHWHNIYGIKCYDSLSIDCAEIFSQQLNELWRIHDNMSQTTSCQNEYSRHVR